jgi:hypothetical protein
MAIKENILKNYLNIFSIKKYFKNELLSTVTNLIYYLIFAKVWHPGVTRIVANKHKLMNVSIFYSLKRILQLLECSMKTRSILFYY